jgi:hypothetical protein
MLAEHDNWDPGRNRTFEVIRRLIYSQLPLPLRTPRVGCAANAWGAVPLPARLLLSSTPQYSELVIERLRTGIASFLVGFAQIRDSLSSPWSRRTAYTAPNVGFWETAFVV